MPTKDNKYTLPLVPDFTEFDPLADDGLPEDDQDSVQSPEDYLPNAHGAIKASEEEVLAIEDTRTPEERTADLFNSMAPYRRVLLGILEYCLEPKLVSDVNDRIDDIQSNQLSVYTAANFCSLLERAGAIERITEDGDLASEVKREPKVVVVDGQEFLEPEEPIISYWQTTSVGAAALEADDPMGRIEKLLNDESMYKEIYLRILELCSAPEGISAKAIGDAVDKDPLVQNPRYYSSHFTKLLEGCDAIEWKDAWVITAEGLKAKEALQKECNNEQ